MGKFQTRCCNRHRPPSSADPRGSSCFLRSHVRKHKQERRTGYRQVHRAFSARMSRCVPKGERWKDPRNHERHRYFLRWQGLGRRQETRNLAHRHIWEQHGNLFDYPECCVQEFGTVRHPPRTRKLQMMARAHQKLAYVPCKACSLNCAKESSQFQRDPLSEFELEDIAQRMREYTAQYRTDMVLGSVRVPHASIL